MSHHVVTDDLEGATAVLNWLSTMPPIIGIPPANLASSDPIERSITYAPAGSEYLSTRNDESLFCGFALHSTFLYCEYVFLSISLSLHLLASS